MMPPRPTPGEARLSMIAEDGTHQPSAAKVSRSTTPLQRTKGQRYTPPPRASVDTAPPAYTLWDVTGPKGEKLADLRNNKYIARRGGWKRLCGILLLLVLLAVGLGVGLGVGLSRRNANASSTNSNTSSGSNGSNGTAGPFPQGSYAFPADLVNVATSCTANPSTWQCWPYHTYAQDAGSSGVTFNWIISNSSGSSQLLISSSSNPFAISFSNASLTLLDSGTANEHYAFSVTLPKYVQPPESLDASGTLDGCWFNTTMLAGALYTKKQAQQGATTGNSSMAAQSQGWSTWPGAMEVNQTIGGGDNVPNCYQITNTGLPGSQVTSGLSPQPSGQECGCYYRNFALS